MIKRPNNWESVPAFTDRKKLPVGGYVCRIKRAVVQSYQYGDQLCVLFDIESGEFADFYQQDFDGNTNKEKKWKGVLRQWIPVDDGSERDEITKSAFKGFVNAVEDSNRGYEWAWDERTLSGKQIGILFRNEEWEYEGKTGWAVRPFRAISVESVESGNFNIPKDKPLANKPEPTTASSSFQAIEEEDGDLPF